MSAPHVLLNNTLLPSSSAHIPAASEGFLFGHGIFETIKILDGHPVFLTQHHTRLTASAGALDLPYITSVADLRERLHRVISANALTLGSAKIVLFNASADASPPSAGELILTRANSYSPETYTRGFRLQTVPTAERINVLSGHKTLNYLANLRAKRAALAAGFDEPLFITPDSVVIEGATTNIFAVRDGVILTPALAYGPLPGIVRAEVLAHLSPARVQETRLTLTDLRHASEVFVTNALLGIMPVNLLDDRNFNVAHAPVTHSLLTAHRAREIASFS